MNLFIFGAGQIGQAACKYAKDLGYETEVFDNNEENLDKCKQWSDIFLLQKETNFEEFFQYLDNKHHLDLENSSKNPSSNLHGVVSCLPYFLNIDLARECIKRKIPYFDLGGCISVDNHILKLHQDNGYKSIVQTSLGLAPGLINYLTVKSLNDFSGLPNTVNTYVGGIPNKQLDKLGYSLTWSYNGLIQEYEADCEILKDGKVEVIPGLENYTYVKVLGENLEAATTSGGIGETLYLLKDKGIKNVQYRTLRHIGHYAEITPYLHKYLKKKFPTLSKDNLKLALEKSTEIHKNEKDVIYLHVELYNNSYGLTKSWKIKAEENISAMQKATSVSLISAVDASLKVKHEGEYNTVRFLSNSNFFWENLYKLGLFK